MNTSDIFVLGADAQSAGGYFQVAATGAVAPTDATTPLGSEWKSAGILTQDGVTRSETKSTTPIKDASGAIVRVILTDYGVRVTCSLLAPTLKTFEAMYGAGNVTVDAEGNLKHTFKKTETPVQAWAFAFVDGGRKVRLYLPAAQIVEVSDKVYNVETPTTYDIALECRPNEAGEYAVEWTQGAGAVVVSPDIDED